MKHILVIGSANVDMTMGVPRLPMKGETVTDGRFLQTFGGKGANQAVAATRAGAAVRFVACLGSDDHGRAVHAALLAEGIDLTGIVWTQKAATGAALVMFDAEGANYLAVAPGSNYELTPEHVTAALLESEQVSLLLLQCEIAEETLNAALAGAAAARIPVLFNHAPARPLETAAPPQGDIGLVVNEIEAEVISGIAVQDPKSALSAARVLREQGYRFVVVTLGAQGACVLADEGQLHVPAPQVTAVDSTAAGDSFCGALGAALIEGASLFEAVRFATVAGSLSVQRAGAQSSIPRREQIEAARQNR